MQLTGSKITLAQRCEHVRSAAPSASGRVADGRFPGLKPWAESCSHLRGINHPDVTFYKYPNWRGPKGHTPSY